MLPNFLKYSSPLDDKKDEAKSVDVAELDDNDLQNIGEFWTAKLIEHAKQRRTNRMMNEIG